MNGRLAILVPSRGRPLTFARFATSWIWATAGCSDLILRNGEADPRRHEYECFEKLPNLIRVVGPDDGFKSTWPGTAGYNPAQQDLWTRYPGYDAYLCIEDDTVLHTPGFDRWLLDTLKEYPNRLGVIELYDRAQQIHCLTLSNVWCDTLGYLCHPDLGENAFEQTLLLAHEVKLIRGAKGYAEFTHHPHVRAYGYTGDERRGAVEVGNEHVVAAYRKSENYLFNEWMPENFVTTVDRLLAVKKRGQP